MQPDVKTRLHDVLTAARHLQSHAQGKTVEEYRTVRLLRAAVEREFEIIGEALNHAMREAPELEARITDARKVVAFRNILIHGYSVVDDAQVWHVLEYRLPQLIQEVQALLNE